MSDQTDGPKGSGSTRSGQDDPPDMETLAKRYMELWGKQVSAMAADPGLAEAMSKTMDFMAETAKSGGRMPPGMSPGPGMPPGMTPNGASANDATPPDTDSAAPGSATTGPASGPSGADMDGLAERIDSLDRRVALLEAALGGILAQSGRRNGD
ncbi:hypothetical protein [Rhodospirillum sp. A1_3_36]|uniref:hypothetical protein n=1 Tax=Rhodospirillum sp. A1_3_36 TaxID=3391666 RepID=UPI0039A5007E